MARETGSGGVGEREQFASGLLLASPRPSPTEISLRRSGQPSAPASSASPPLVARLAGMVPSRARMVRATVTALETEVERGTPFLLLPVLLGFGAIVYFGLPEEPGFLPLVGGVVVVSALLAIVPAHWQAARLAALAALFCVLGVLVAKIETWRAGTDMLGSEISTRLTGRVIELEHMANGRVRLTIDVLATAKPKLRYSPDRVRLSARKIPHDLAIGSTIEGLARLMPPTGPIRPDSYDFSFTSYFAGIGASGFFLRGPELAPHGQPISARARFFNRVENLRNAIADRIRGQIGGPEGEIAAALVVGIRAGIPEEINEAMRRTGIYHIISISGLHMALVAGTVMGALRAVLALFPGFASRHPVKKHAAGAALMAIAAYLFISGGDVAAQRSCFMLAIMLTALLFDRGALTTRNLAISALVIIAISPHEVVGPSFQMSFAATAALVGAYALWSERHHMRRRAAPSAERSFAAMLAGKAWGAVGALMLTSVVAGVATTAFGIYHFQRVSPLSLVANLAVMPSVSVLVMPFGVAGSLAMPLGLDAPFFYVMGKGLTIVIAVSQWLSERSPIDAVGLISLHSLFLLTLALVIVTMATTWLRALAIPFALAGVLTLADVRTPDVLVSEDGRLLAVPVGHEMLAVNRARPNAFTVDNWKRALRTEEVVGPVDSRKSGPDSHSRRKPAGSPASASVIAPESAASSASGHASESEPGHKFDCHDGLCVAVHTSGAVIVHAADGRIARKACDYASLIVIDDATAGNVCGNAPPLIVTKRDLAKYGSAAIYLADAASAQPAEIRYALSQPYRPWHIQRQFSREARGLAPYKPRSKNTGATRFRQKSKSSSGAASQPDHRTGQAFSLPLNTGE